MSDTPRWDVALRQTLQHGARRFELQLAWRSDARRLVLVGPSGAGKSQTLKLIAGLARPDAGHVRLSGDTLFDAGARIDLSPQQRRLAYTFQHDALFPHLSVRQNIAFALHRGWRNPPRDARHETVERWLTSFGLQAVQHQYPDQLSGGQRQRTALARALATEPRALLLDEPFSALDRALRNRLRDELADLQAMLRIPMLVITHDEDEVQSLADEVLHVDNGHRVERVDRDARDGACSSGAEA